MKRRARRRVPGHLIGIADEHGVFVAVNPAFCELVGMPAEELVGASSHAYAAPDADTAHNRTIEWSHGIGAVVSALAQAGLRIEWLHEHPFTFAVGWPFLVRDGGVFRLPDDVPSLPLMYSLLATAPA